MRANQANRYAKRNKRHEHRVSATEWRNHLIGERAQRITRSDYDLPIPPGEDGSPQCMSWIGSTPFLVSATVVGILVYAFALWRHYGFSLAWLPGHG